MAIKSTSKNGIAHLRELSKDGPALTNTAICIRVPTRFTNRILIPTESDLDDGQLGSGGIKRANRMDKIPESFRVS